jgi:hypothetical protein
LKRAGGRSEGSMEGDSLPLIGLWKRR